MYPLLVFPTLSSALLPASSYSRVGFPRFFPIEIDACLFASLSPCVLTLSHSSFLTLFFRSSFSARLSPDMCLIFAATVDFRPLAPACAALVCICVSILRPFFPITLSRLSSPSFPPVPPTLSSQLVSACRRRVLRHISPSLCINFSSLLLSFPANDQYFVTFRLHTRTLSCLCGIKSR